MQRINVSVRARPLSPEDAKSSPWCISGNSIFIPNHLSKFEFDRIFGEDTKTVEVYESRTKDIVAAAVRGFNGTVFAYGQTNSGKTHTMRGSAAEPGVIPLAVQHLFDIIQEVMDREFLLRMSYMEIYNEEINDLLVPEHRKLQIHESNERGIFVAGLREEIVASAEQVLELLAFGESHRHIGETNMNVYSSRSHTIFRMIIESKDDSQDDDTGTCDAVRVSVLNLVDLAGSERAAKTGAEGVRLKEGSHINKSLMTLGTVIKKLSEGAESQGSHVPYRDSKLTRILQPALGGNANTAIICNITLAQIHADETKSSLQFASRALRVTNCVIVNEILTDAALLKRQKREIEELRAKLQGSHSEHFEEEILNLRNTLLQTELERERIALELEEEKKAQAEKEKRLLEQDKKIKNLSSMVLCSNRDDNRDRYKKEKRRDTWCPGKLSRETVKEMNSSSALQKDSASKPMRSGREMGPLLPFEELVNEVSTDGSCKEEKNCSNDTQEDRALPQPHALLHVTSRRKATTKKKTSLECTDLEQMQKEYEDLLLRYETQKSTSDLKITYLTRRLEEAGLYMDNTADDSVSHAYKSEILDESEAILVIKQLQEKINMLEMEKSLSQQNFDNIVELVTEQQISADVKFEEIYEELQNAREEAKVARVSVASVESFSRDEGFKYFSKASKEVQEILAEVQNSRNSIEAIFSVVDELFKSSSAMLTCFTDLKCQASEDNSLFKAMVYDHTKLWSCMKNKISELEKEKIHLYNQSMDRQSRIKELSLDVENSVKAFDELSEQREIETRGLLSEIQALQKDILSLSSSSLAKEKENMRKDFEKTKAKLKETEFKLRNTIQEKTKLEGEKACAEREIKKLHAQKNILERDISKQSQISERRCDSVVDRRSSIFDPKRPKGLSIAFDQSMQEDYRKLEVLAFEMETTIASLEEELASARAEKEQATSTIESLDVEMQSLSDKLVMSNSELAVYEEAVSTLISDLEESKSHNQKLECSLRMLVEEKEELATQLTEALLAMEEVKAIRSSIEKTSIQSIQEASDSYNTKMSLLSSEVSQVRSELESSKEEYKVLMDRLLASEKNTESEKSWSMEKCQENERLRDDLQVAVEFSKKSQEASFSQLSKLKSEIEELKKKLTCLETEKHTDQISNRTEKAKLRMRLRGTQHKLEAALFRHSEAVEELDLMNRNYEAASQKLKDKLSLYCTEVLALKKQLAAKGQ
ncbi:Centromere-associated protein E [Heracleum sosnowskyi]|uniref:Centromere-associated protein E n=1 Tax=Heracleum sosnowskyi TaxID=360622 RepID=A0AAD8GZ51_9APIA|nr:Centromere-associated protein E [Heracleum sosnowskyi]